jgi:CheY-like chemotaxis protein
VLSKTALKAVFLLTWNPRWHDDKRRLFLYSVVQGTKKGKNHEHCCEPCRFGVVAMKPMVRLLIADDRLRSRKGLRALLATQPAIEIAGEATDGWEALRLVEACRPDVVLMDVRMPAMDGLQATQLIKARWPSVKVIILTMYPAHQAEALAAGADAFLVKGCPAEKLLATILSDIQKEVDQ